MPDQSVLARRPKVHLLRDGTVFSLPCWRIRWPERVASRAIRTAVTRAKLPCGALDDLAIETDAVAPEALSRVAFDLMLVIQAGGASRHLQWLRNAPALVGPDVIACPTLDDILVEHAVRVVSLLAELAANTQDLPAEIERVAGDLESLASNGRALAPGDSTLQVLIEAARRGVPARRCVVNFPLYEFGDGILRRSLFQGFTGSVGHVATLLSTHKDLASELMRADGLPVPANAVVEDLDAAFAWAQRTGWPVVLKPTARDRGVGVTANVGNADQLRQAFLRARAYGRVLIEKHVPGEKYRLFVLGGRCVAAYRNIPPYVVGDGTASIRTLIERLRVARRDDPTLDPEALPAPDAPELMAWLSRSGLTPDSVVRSGEHVRLSSVASVGAGAEREFLPLTLFHEDNLRVAEHAANRFGIEVAGVDFITTDPGVSFANGAGAINEINVNPALPFKETGTWMLDHLFGPAGTGRIPVTLVIGALSLQTRSALIAESARAGSALGLLFEDEMHFAGRKDPRVLGRMARATAILLANPRLARAVIQVSDQTLLRQGLPPASFSACVITLDEEPRARLLARTGLEDFLIRSGVAVSTDPMPSCATLLGGAAPVSL